MDPTDDKSLKLNSSTNRPKRMTLVFQNWMRNGSDISFTEEGSDLSLGDFHSGTVFSAIIMLDEDEESDLRQALATGACPVFYVTELN